ncbi:hypothetical protein [Lactiplantibacillus pentosus]
MSKEEKLYLVCDDTDSLPLSKEDMEKTRKLDNDPVVQANIQKAMEQAKQIFGLLCLNCPQQIYNKDEEVTRGWFNAIIR